MKNISVQLTELDNGTIRATGRHCGSTVFWKDGSSAVALLSEAMRETCSAHSVGSSYDLTYIELNDLAKSHFARI